MHIAVFGASGGTGLEFVKQALSKGHEVTAIVRNPDSFELRHQNLHTVVGDALKPNTFGAALNGKDAVVSAVGISSFWRSLRPMDFYRRSIENIIGLMHSGNVKRLLCITSTGVIHNRTAPLFYRLLIQPLLRNKYEDMRQMEAKVTTSGLQWTIVRPFRLTKGEKTERYRTASDGELEHARTISRADVAHLLLNCLEQDEHVRETVAVAY